MELVLNAGPVAKFVLALLCLFSVVCWALMVEKWWQFRKIRKEPLAFLRLFREGRRFSVVCAGARTHRESPLAQLDAAGCQEAGTPLGGVEMLDQALDDTDEGLPGD